MRPGPEIWRSLDELADNPEFRKWVECEFPSIAPDILHGASRRQFLKVMAASFAFGGLAGCERPVSERIVPRARTADNYVAGFPLYFATALSRSGYLRGVLVESYSGRPIKVEGNPDHPASLGRTDLFAQADLLTLYDPQRSRAPMRGGRVASWEVFFQEFLKELAQVAPEQGRGFHILTGATTSPTLQFQLAAVKQRFPAAQWHVHEPVDEQNALAGSAMAFGRAVQWVYRFDRASRVLALDCNFLFDLPGSIRYARDFAAGRGAVRSKPAGSEMNRLYVAEPAPTITGTSADHRIALPIEEIETLTIALARELGAIQVAEQPVVGDETQRWIRAVAADLREHRGSAVVVAGRALSPAAQATVCAINAALGAIGETAVPIEPVEASGTDGPADLKSLTETMAAGEVQALLISGANPAYTAPADLAFASLLEQVPFSVHHGLYVDETARRCTWHLPAAHELESWSDGRAFDGTASIVQPLIAPLYGGRTIHSLLASVLGKIVDEDGREPIEEYWRGQVSGQEFREWWVRALQKGVIPNSTSPALDIQLDGEAASRAIGARPSTGGASGEFTLMIEPDARVWDGSYSNNGWLQETPDPLSKITWDNALWVAPAVLEQKGFRPGELVILRAAEREIEAAAWPMPGQDQGSLLLTLGYGRTASGGLGDNYGFNVYALRTSDNPWAVGGVEIRGTGREYPLATTQNHHAMEGREPVRRGNLEELIEPGKHIVEEMHDLPSLYAEFKYQGTQWGMVIDLTACIGCNACTVACQAENNVPLVGKDGVIRGREMHWIRVDRYFEGPPAAPRTYHQPLPCMHCENAPCEYVCPTGATQHSHDGLNEMIYNRCIGTRYCSNNCPYKVRRFNFLSYSEADPTIQLVRNPEVTVRARGVMEKCTYCVQRIRAADIEARKEDREIRAGEVLTACQQVCPTNAIIFGNINNPEEPVSALRKLPHHYELLHELNTRPRTTYLAAIRNPNPRLEDGPA